MSKSVLITRELDDNSLFARVLKEKGLKVLGQPFIETKPIPFSSIPVTDWVFFSSRRAIEHFFSQAKTIPASVKWAALSEGTAQELKKHVSNIHFVGTKIKTPEIAQEFAVECENKSVLFPMAIDSLQSVQKNLSFSTRVVNLFVYKTLELTKESVPTVDRVVFTSPSNVRGYLNSTAWKPEQQMAVAIGESTSYELKNHGIKNIVANSYSELALSDAVMKTL